MKKSILLFLYNFLALCARHYISRYDIKVIGITGSVGKTSCRTVVTQVLQQIPSSLRFYSSPKNYNSELWLVFSVFCIEDYNPNIKNLFFISLHILQIAFFWVKKYDVLIAEYGIDSPKDMEQLLKIAVPDIAVLTKLDNVHSENYPDGVEQYWEEKWLLLLSAKNKVFVNMQDEYSKNKNTLLEEYSEIFWDISSLKPQLKKVWEDEIIWDFHYLQKKFSLNLIGEENIHYTKLAIDIALYLWIYLERAEYHFNFHLQDGRFSIFHVWENILIDSSYNAAPESMKQVLWNTKKLRDMLYPDYKIILLLWDMRELWDTSKDSHQNLVNSVQFAESIFTVWPQMYEYFKPELEAQEFPWYLKSFLSSKEAGKSLKKYLKDNTSSQYIVLFKGSQNTIFTEEALAQILPVSQKKHLVRQSEDWKEKKEKFFQSV